MGFLDKVKDLASKNADKVDEVIDKAGDLVDKKTQGKYAGHVDKVQEAARKAARDNAGTHQQPPVQQPPVQQPPVQQSPDTTPPATPSGPPPAS
jgi:antitoxin protein of toxin-antitoxin system